MKTLVDLVGHGTSMPNLCLSLERCKIVTQCGFVSFGGDRQAGWLETLRERCSPSSEETKPFNIRPVRDMV